MRLRLSLPAFAILVMVLSPGQAQDSSPAVAIETVNAIGREGLNSVAATRAARELSALPASAIPQILAGFDSANPLAENLLRSTVETIADRAEREKTNLPKEDLVTFVEQPEQHDPRSRRLAYELLQRVDEKLARSLLPNLLDDPSVELRRDAVAYWMQEAERHAKSDHADEAKAAYRRALSGAVSDDQVHAIAAALKTQGETVDLRRHFGFITSWNVIGPFDNREQKGFAAVYPPEKGIDLDATYEGQLGAVHWQPISTEAEDGVIDIDKSLENWKGSAVYLTTTFDSRSEQAVEFRLGTPNAWKLWVNGKFLFGREEYHRGWSLDQYRVPARLTSGTNTILLKLLQNEQPDDWAQEYKVQMRVVDRSGQAVLPAEASPLR